MIRTLFVSMQELNKGARRPADVPPTQAQEDRRRRRRLHGRRHRLCHAPMPGLEVVLIDRDMEAAEKGKAYSHKLVSDQIMKGRAKTADRDALLGPHHALGRLRRARRAATSSSRRCSRIPKVKAEVIAKVEAADRPAHASSAPTPRRCRSPGSPSTSQRPEQFIGIHFFSPVEKMLLVEVIMAQADGRQGARAGARLCARDQARRRSSSTTPAASTPIAASATTSAKAI